MDGENYHGRTLSWFPRRKQPCHLPDDSNTCLPKISPAHRTIPLRVLRNLRKWSMISETSYDVGSHFMSYVSILEERRRHLRTSKFAIHPYSPMAKYYQMSMSLLWLISLFKDPLGHGFQKCFDYTEPICLNDWKTVMNLLFDFTLMSLALVNFIIGYVDTKTNMVELRLKRIAKRYLITYFVFDISLLPFYLIYYSQVKIVELFYITSAIIWLRIVRMNSVMTYLRQITGWFGLNTFYHEIITFALRIIHLVHWITCLYALFLKFLEDINLESPTDLTINLSYRKSTVYRQYIVSIHIIANSLYNISIDQITVTSDTEQVFYILVLAIGNLFIGYITCQMFVLIKSANSAHGKYENLMHELINFSGKKRLPHATLLRLQRYCRIKYQEQYFNEEQIMAQLTTNLVREVHVFSNSGLLSKTALFQGLPRNVIEDIFCRLHEEFYLENDVVSMIETNCEGMHILAYGTTAVYDESGKELRHFNDGDHFGLMPLVDLAAKSNFRTSNVAVTHCHIYKLLTPDFWTCMRAYPTFKHRVMEDIADRKQFYDRDTHIERELTVMHNLATGMILDRMQTRKNLETLSSYL